LLKRIFILALFIPKISFGLVQYEKDGFARLKGLFIHDGDKNYFILNPEKRIMLKFNIDILASSNNLKLLQSNSKIEVCGYIHKRAANKDGVITLLKIRPLAPLEPLTIHDGILELSNDEKYCARLSSK